MTAHNLPQIIYRAIFLSVLTLACYGGSWTWIIEIPANAALHENNNKGSADVAFGDLFRLRPVCCLSGLLQFNETTQAYSEYMYENTERSPLEY